jgi:hypothetical protein
MFNLIFNLLDCVEDLTDDTRREMNRQVDVSRVSNQKLKEQINQDCSNTQQAVDNFRKATRK